jgi:hypothetical protein
MGIALAPKKGGGVQPIYIKFSQNNTNFQLTAHDLATGERVGFLNGTRFHEGNDYLRSGHWFVGRPNEYNGYGGNPAEVEKICVDQVTNESPNLGQIGVILMKAAPQQFPNAQNRVILDAVRNTHSYYYKQGYRVSDVAKRHLNAEYARIAKSGTIPRKDNGSVQMHLPNAARAVWSREIQEAPIGFPEPQIVELKDQ